jgi:hypothetical protein
MNKSKQIKTQSLASRILVNGQLTAVFQDQGGGKDLAEGQRIGQGPRQGDVQERRGGQDGKGQGRVGLVDDAFLVFGQRVQTDGGQGKRVDAAYEAKELPLDRRYLGEEMGG